MNHHQNARQTRIADRCESLGIRSIHYQQKIDIEKDGRCLLERDTVLAGILFSFVVVGLPAVGASARRRVPLEVAEADRRHRIHSVHPWEQLPPRRRFPRPPRTRPPGAVRARTPRPARHPARNLPLLVVPHGLWGVTDGATSRPRPRAGSPGMAVAARSTPRRPIKAPLLVIQVSNDPRVKKAESEPDRRRPARSRLSGGVHHGPDEGHRFAKPVNSMAVFARRSGSSLRTSRAGSRKAARPRSSRGSARSPSTGRA
jgi:hypothetical protein